jgi:hypothetical protein
MQDDLQSWVGNQAKGIMVLQADEIMYGSDWDTMREINREVSTRGHYRMEPPRSFR